MNDANAERSKELSSRQASSQEWMWRTDTLFFLLCSIRNAYERNWPPFLFVWLLSIISPILRKRRKKFWLVYRITKAHRFDVLKGEEEVFGFSGVENSSERSLYGCGHFCWWLITRTTKFGVKWWFVWKMSMFIRLCQGQDCLELSRKLFHYTSKITAPEPRE